MKKGFFIIAMILYFSNLSTAQISGGQVRSNKNYYINQNPTLLMVKDNSFIIQAKVLLNRDADFYQLTLALSETGKSPKDCQDKMMNKIEDFKPYLKDEKVKGIETDFISITPVYDFRKEGEIYVQYLEEYELKKNLIITVAKKSMLEEIIVFATNLGIHDVVKVDYLVYNNQEIYNELFKEAVKVIESKKKNYLAITNAQIRNESLIYAESFQTVEPKNSYKSYYNALTKNLRLPYKSRKKIKRIAMNRTYYYDALSYSGMDKVINPEKSRPGLQFVYVLQVKFTMKENNSLKDKD